jgi:Holliday junction resolvase
MEKSQFNNSAVSKGISFEKLLAAIYEEMGYDVERTKVSGDQGADLILTKEGLKTVVQAKRSDRDVSNGAVQEVISAKIFYEADHGIVVSSSGFQPSAIELAEKEGDIELIDMEHLKKMMDVYDITPKKLLKPISEITIDDVRPKHPDYKKIIQGVLQYVLRNNEKCQGDAMIKRIHEKLKPELLEPENTQEIQEKIIDILKNDCNIDLVAQEKNIQEMNEKYRRNNLEVLQDPARPRLSMFMDTLRKLEGEPKLPVPEQVFVGELVKSEKFSEEESRNYIHKMIREAAMYESAPGHYNTV